MSTLLSHWLTGLQVLVMPINLIALLTGTLAGALLGMLCRRIGVSYAAALVILMPLALPLDPTTGLILLGSGLAAALVTVARDGPDTSNFTHKHSVPLMAGLAGIVVVGGSGLQAAWLQTAAPADSFWLLMCATATAIMLAAVTHPAGWLAAIGLTLAGVALELSPLRPLDTAQTSPVPLLFGLLVIGPAALALARPLRIASWSTPLGGIELAALVLPAFLIGVPATRGVSIFALTLGENGLYLGPKLMLQRPKLVLGFVLAAVVAGVLATIARLLIARSPRATRWPRFPAQSSTRLAAGITLVLGMASLALSGFQFDRTDLAAAIVLGITTIAGAIAAAFGLELAPLVTGLVIGGLVQAALRMALVANGGSLPGALTSGSRVVLFVALAAIAALLLGPVLIRRFVAALSPSSPTTPSRRAVP